MKPSGLYIHIPFCTQKCRYCDFYSITQKADFHPYHPHPQFIERLLQDVRFFKERSAIESWKTVYIGGGTPSLLHPDDISTLAAGIRKEQHLPVQEFTIEANPEDIHPEWLAVCSESGINRLSIGVQTFDNDVLAVNGRRGSKEKTITALETIKRRWQGELSCDLIAGLTGQTAASLSGDVRRLIDYRIDHLSLYGLCSEAPLPEAREDFISELLRENTALLAENGYIRYEVSNFSYQDKHRSLHNQIYWNMEPYAGIGPAACGTLIHEDTGGKFIAAERFEGSKDIDKWMTAADRLSVYSYEHIDRNTFLEEVLLMGFRLSEGINRSAFARRFGADITAFIGNTLSRWEKRRQCRIEPNRVYLTEDGMLFLNRFLVDALSELDAK
ncbi:coproporphyrinogen-III oxidase family protein [Treponema sp. OMZ 805]|uniref:coproporphyrinogen-III oxidase family protein n=1 Tax=Treponema sp. OMZ 805 TaxID=2726068 RepID=UPI003D91B099